MVVAPASASPPTRFACSTRAGTDIFVLRLTAHRTKIGIRGICYACGRYVHVIHEVVPKAQA